MSSTSAAHAVARCCSPPTSTRSAGAMSSTTTTSPRRSSTVSSSVAVFYVSTAHRFEPNTSPPTSSPGTTTLCPEAAEFPEPTPQNFRNAQDLTDTSGGHLDWSRYYNSTIQRGVRGTSIS